MGLILFGVFLFLLIIGVPVAFSICTAAGVTVLSGLGQAKLLILIQRMFEACNSFSLIAVPFFILAGDLLSKGKISKLLVEFCESLLGMIRGGLSVVSVLIIVVEPIAASACLLTKLPTIIESTVL